MKIYTRTGDRGRTSLVGGRRVPKTHYRLEAYGTIDELSAHLGLLASYLPPSCDQLHTLRHIQHTMFVLGAQLATPSDVPPTATVTPAMVTHLEQAIDRIDRRLPPLRAFVLPCGCVPAAQSHVCRTVCRRAERRVHALARRAPLPLEVCSYLNRLSDYLFLLARLLNSVQGTAEIFWENPCQ